MIDFPNALEKLGIIQIDVWAIVISLLNLLILFLIVKRFLFKPVQRIIGQRKAGVEAVYKEAEEARAEAEADRAFYEERREHAEEEAEDILRKATEQAKKNSDHIMKETRDEISSLREKAARDIAQEKVKAINDAKNEIASISVQIAEKVVERTLNEEDHREFVNRMVEDLDKSQKE